MKTAIIEMISPTMPACTIQTVDLDNLPKMPISTPDGYHQLEIFKVQGGMNPMQLDDEFHFRFQNTLTGEQSRQKIAVKPGYNSQPQPFNIRMELVGVVGASQFAGGGNIDPAVSRMTALEELVTDLHKRVRFTDKAVDLFITGHLDKDRFMELKALYRSDNEEDKQLAEKIVEAKHEQHIQL
jgi:hypothetical protein